MGYTYYYEEIPLNWIIAVEKEIEKRLREKEYELALRCSSLPAYITITMKKTGQKFIVARDRRYLDSRYENPGNIYKIQILTEDCEKVIESYTYHEKDNDPLFSTAVKIIRLNYQYRYFDED